jgi:hypothetical protein
MPDIALVLLFLNELHSFITAMSASGIVWALMGAGIDEPISQFGVVDGTIWAVIPK